MDEKSHAIEKLRKAYEKLESEYEHHVDIIMELVRQVFKDGEIIKDKDGLINQQEKRCRTLKKISNKKKPLLQINERYELYEGIDEEISCQS